MSILAVAVQLEAVNCVRFLLAVGAKVGASEVEAAFRGGKIQLMGLMWNAYPCVKPLELAIEAVKSWNAAGLRWLLGKKMGDLSSGDLVRLFEAACLSGSYSCGSSVLSFSGSAASHLRGLSPVGVVGRVLRDGVVSLKAGRKALKIPEYSMAAGYADQLRAWLPYAKEVKLVAKHEGRDPASVNAFIDAAKGRAKTVTFVKTQSGVSICGGYLDVAWVENGYAIDPGRRSFMFTLENHLRVPPAKFAQKRSENAACTWRGDCFYFGCFEGFIVWHGDRVLSDDLTYDAPVQGAALFDGDRGREIPCGPLGVVGCSVILRVHDLGVPTDRRWPLAGAQ
jgi:hypothetical protein